MSQSEAVRNLATTLEHIGTDSRYSTEAVGLWVRSHLPDILAALRSAPEGGHQGALIHLLREAEPTVARDNDEIVLLCPDGTITDDLYEALEAAVTSPATPLPTIKSEKTGGDREGP